MKRPSKIKTVKAKYTKLLPPYFAGITLFGTVYTNSKKLKTQTNASDEINSNFKSHETIHVRQAQGTHDSWLLFYIIYIWQWICNLPLIFIDLHAPYKFIPIELEAFHNERDWTYVDKGAAYEWKEFNKLTLKEKYKLAKAYYKQRYTLWAFIKMHKSEFLKNEKS